MPQALIGLWALLGPQSFYDDFPAGTDGWVHVLGPFDEHLVTDVGSLFVALGLVLAFAAFSLRRGAVVAAATAGSSSPCRTSSGTCSTSSPTRPRTRWRTPSRSAGPWLGGSSSCCCAAAGTAPRRNGHGDGGARIAPVPDHRAGLLARAAFRYSKREFGAVTEPLRCTPTTRDPVGYAGLEYATAKADRVPNRLKALAATKAAALAGCEFCMDIGSMISGKAGVTEEQLRALPASTPRATSSRRTRSWCSTWRWA